MKTKLEEKSVNEIYELMVDKIWQVPSEIASSSEWQKINLEFYDFIAEVGNHKIFRKPLIALNSILLFIITEDYKIGHKLATPIFGDIIDKSSIDSIWELKLFSRVSIFLRENFLELKKLSQYAFDFLESCDDDFIYEKSTLICNTMFALLKMNREDSLEYKDEIEETFNELYLMIKDISKKYRIDHYLKHSERLYEEFTNGERFSEEVDVKKLETQDEYFISDFNKQVIKFHDEDKLKQLKSLIKELKSNLGGNL